jgi:hypothetical protein
MAWASSSVRATWAAPWDLSSANGLGVVGSCDLVGVSPCNLGGVHGIDASTTQPPLAAILYILQKITAVQPLRICYSQLSVTLY